MRTRFREDKTTQAAAKLLRLRGGKMSHLKLIKLLYLLDREALLRFGRPVTFDWYYSMPHGPVLSYTLDLINGERAPGEPSYWGEYIAEKSHHEVGLRPGRECPVDQLSPAEEQLIEEVFARYGRMSRWELRDFSHTLPEWTDPRGSSVRIEHRDILRAGGTSEEDIAHIEAELEESALADSVFG
jgi:uncharacterized phage-associated protein